MDNEKSPAHELARDVAKHMDGWAYDGEPQYGPNITDGSRRFRVYIDRRGRVEFAACLPARTKRGQYVGESGNNPEITCALNRGPEAIAREITRRLLPDLCEAHTKMAAEVAQWDAHDQGVDAGVEKIVSTGGRHAPGDRDRIYLSFARDEKGDAPSGEAEVNSGSSVEIRIRGLTPDQVVAIIALINSK